MYRVIFWGLNNFLWPDYYIEFLCTCTISGGYFCFPPFLPPPEAKNRSHTETMGAAGHCLYRRLWPSGAGSNIWRALIGSWVMPPSNGSIEIERGGEKNITINHSCGGGDCGSGGNSESKSNGYGGGDGGSEGIDDYDDSGGDGGGGGARTTARASSAMAAVAAAGALTVASAGQQQRWRRRGR